jgi:outer membrane immunogenic protein
MKKMVLGAVAAAALAVTAGQASAEGLIPDGRIAAGPIHNSWNGFYIGAGVGGGAMVTDVKENSWFGSSNFDGIGGEGAFGTVSVGFDRQIRPRWVLGVFADYDFGSGVSTDVSTHSWFGSSHSSIDQTYAWAVGGRLGYLVNPATLVYGTGGYTETELKSLGDSQKFTGWFAGAGIETMLRDHWSLKLEYRFSQFDDVKFGNDCFGLSVEPSEQTARLVLSYKFGDVIHRGGLKD